MNQVTKSLGQFMDVTVWRAQGGGTGVHNDIQALTNGAQIVVATPPRVKDMISSGALSLKALKLFILDEVDEMLSRGFKEPIYDCFQCLPYKVKVALFSSEISTEILEITKRFMTNPVRILVRNPSSKNYI